MLKKFLTRKMMKSQLKDVPEGQQEQMMKMIEENPDFFGKIGSEVQKKMKEEGKDQMTATMEVMRAHQDELQKIAGK